MKEDIILFNRYGYDIRLIHKENLTYALSMPNEIIYRISYKKEQDLELEFVDPSGGPMLSEGYKLNKEYEIESIYKSTYGILINVKSI